MHARVSGILYTSLFAILLSGCVDAAKHSASLHSTNERDMTVGVVQREIRKGMTQAEVAESLGSPNIVQRDSAGKETWIYDKIATEASYSNSSGGGIGLVGAGGGSTLVLGGLLGGYSANAGASASTQKTLTVIIKYDKAGLVDTFSYHSSKF